jgi:hypothetical protein
VAYRTIEKAKTGKHVEVRSYLDLVAAELALSNLRSNDIEGFVLEAAGFNPLLAAAAGGHRLMVDETDLERAQGVLRRADLPTELLDDEPAGTVRCPRCELPYCTFRRFKLGGMVPSAIVAAIAAPAMFLGKRRWHCDKCEHVWDDPTEGPAAMTPLHADDPRPVFLLGRPNGAPALISGIVLGLGAAGGLAAVGLPIVGALVMAGAAYLAWRFAQMIPHFACSEPGCRERLAPDAEACIKCLGVVAGRIRYLHEHYAAAADVRRELAQARGRAEQKRLKAAASRKAKSARPRTD